MSAATPKLDWAVARELRAAGHSLGEIAARFGVTKQAVTYACADEPARLAANARNAAWRAVHRPAKPRPTLRDRLLSRVVAGENGCWIWTGALDTNGYGKIHVGPHRGKPDRAHRVAYRLFVGEIPDGLHLDHLCRNRRCVSPAHLEPVTNRENILRGEGMGARYARRDRCSHGHFYTPENTQIRTDGARRCLTCRRESNRRARESRRAA